MGKPFHLRRTCWLTITKFLMLTAKNLYPRVGVIKRANQALSDRQRISKQLKFWSLRGNSKHWVCAEICGIAWSFPSSTRNNATSSYKFQTGSDGDWNAQRKWTYLFVSYMRQFASRPINAIDKRSWRTRIYILVHTFIDILTG